jgi:hypothetical protein
MRVSTPLVCIGRVIGRLRRLEAVNVRETLVLRRAGLVPAPEPLLVALAPDRLLANQAPGTIETGMTPASAKSAAKVVRRLRKLRPAEPALVAQRSSQLPNPKYKKRAERIIRLATLIPSPPKNPRNQSRNFHCIAQNRTKVKGTGENPMRKVVAPSLKDMGPKANLCRGAI